MFIAILDFSTSADDRSAALAQLDAERPQIVDMPGCVAFRVYASRVTLTDVTVVHGGVLRLQSGDTEWALPPARAALIAARRPIRVTIPQPATTSSALFDVAYVPAPPQPLIVFDLSPLARALVSECTQWGESDQPLPEYGNVMFGALAAATWSLAARPSPAAMKAGRSEPLRRATRRSAR